MQPKPRPWISTYFADPESRVEMTRLLDKGRMLTHQMGLFPAHCNLDGVRDILDIACGPGGWVLEAALAHPTMRITGIDISRVMLQFAETQAEVQTLSNTRFLEMDATRLPLDFPDASFDLVNARTLLLFMPRDAWPRLFAECQRILRPGGVLCLTEFEMGQASLAPTYQELCRYFTMAMKLAGRSFSAAGDTLGVIEQLAPWLEDAGFLGQPHINTEAFAINFSYGSFLHTDWCQDFLVLAKLALPFVSEMGKEYPEAGIPHLQKLEHMLYRTEEEMSWQTFRGILIYVRAWGCKLMG